jgi:hypothetical protein
MKNLMKIVRNFGVVFMALTFVAAPILQANRVSQGIGQNQCSCCCCVAANQRHIPAQTELEPGTCGCHVSESKTPHEIPLEVQLPKETGHDNDMVVIAEVIADEIIRSEAVCFTRSLTIRETGPPLYLSHSAFLI